MLEKRALLQCHPGLATTGQDGHRLTGLYLLLDSPGQLTRRAIVVEQHEQIDIAGEGQVAARPRAKEGDLLSPHGFSKAARLVERSPARIWHDPARWRS